MGLRSWIYAKLGMPDFRAEQVERILEWERNQTNDWNLIESDPLKLEIRKAEGLLQDRPMEAFQQLHQMALCGSVWSMVLVGWCYGQGIGVAKSTAEAELWYRLAYEGGSEQGLLRYSQYLAWRGERDDLQRVYEAGWDRGFVPAVYRLIEMRLRPTMSLADRLTWKPALEWAAAAGHPAARFLLMKYLSRGWFGVQGVPRGLRLLGKALAAIIRGDPDRPIPA